MAAPIPDKSEQFRERYARLGADAALAAEIEALGSDYQANGYTTAAQADQLGAVLELTGDDVLADLGAGCGWPGLYLASRTGCSVVSMDPVAEGMGVAHRRIQTDGMAGRAWAVRANAEAIPLRPGSIDAAVHTDLVC